eukprot:589512-Karenia_brevis.AAC.1
MIEFLIRHHFDRIKINPTVPCWPFMIYMVLYPVISDSPANIPGTPFRWRSVSLNLRFGLRLSLRR